MSEQKKERMVWLDWMKVMAIFSIIWGHFFSAGHLYLYVFSVQTFCLISGFLYKKAANMKTCIQKCFWQLFVPTVIMSVIMHLETYFRCMVLRTTYDISWPWFFKWLLLGHRWCMGPCWYFYTLIVIRLIMQMLPDRKWVYMLVFMIFSTGVVYFHHLDIEVSNANVNVLVCMPLFLIGVLLKPLKPRLCALQNFWMEMLLLAVSIVLVILCGNYNGYVWMYLCQYGNYYTLYIIGGLAGVVLMFTISLWLSRLPYRKMVLTLSKGSVFIIGLHIIIVRRLTELPNRMWGEDLFYSVLILCSFISIIRLAELFFPILLGRHQ